MLERICGKCGYLLGPIWQASKPKYCSGCGVKLDYSTFEVEVIPRPHAPAPIREASSAENKRRFALGNARIYQMTRRPTQTLCKTCRLPIIRGQWTAGRGHTRGRRHLSCAVKTNLVDLDELPAWLVALLNTEIVDNASTLSALEPSPANVTEGQESGEPVRGEGVVAA
jgi:hypothetical protein